MYSEGMDFFSEIQSFECLQKLNKITENISSSSLSHEELLPEENNILGQDNEGEKVNWVQKVDGNNESEGQSPYNEKDDEYCPTEKKKIYRKKKKINNSYVKNFLVNIKPHIISFLKSQKVGNHPNYINFQREKGTNLEEFNELFKSQSLRPYLEEMFETHHLMRTIQISNLSLQGKKVYIKKIQILKKGLKMGKIHRLC